MQTNLKNEMLEECSCNPMTGYYRDGLCRTGEDDFASHTVCVVLTKDFLKYSKLMENDLSTPIPEYNFPGLKEGDRWCLCAARWKEAYKAGMAPYIIPESTSIKALEIVDLEMLEKYYFKEK
jgi:uncharacterized protein (DUF2237 family)